MDCCQSRRQMFQSLSFKNRRQGTTSPRECTILHVRGNTELSVSALAYVHMRALARILRNHCGLICARTHVLVVLLPGQEPRQIPVQLGLHEPACSLCAFVHEPGVRPEFRIRLEDLKIYWGINF